MKLGEAQIIRAQQLNGKPVDPALAARAVAVIKAQGRVPFDLAPQQVQIITLLCNGARSYEVARELGMTVSAVSSALVLIRGKIKARSTVQAAVMWDRVSDER